MYPKDQSISLSCPQEVLCRHQAAICSALRPVYLHGGGLGSALQDPECTEQDEGGPEDPSRRPGEAELILRPPEGCPAATDVMQTAPF